MRILILFLLCLTCLWSSGSADFINDKIRAVPTRQQIIDWFGTPQVKLAFVIDSSAVTVAANGLRTFVRKSRTICFVDFSPESYSGRIQTIKAGQEALLPVISPDGKFVTYATGVESDGEDQNGKMGKVWMCSVDSSATPVRIADTGFVPRFVKNAQNPTVLYSTCSKNPSGPNASCTCGKVVKKEIINGVAQPGETVWNGGSYFGGLSYDNRYLATGWLSGDGSRMLDLQKGNAGPSFIHLVPAKTTGNKDTLISVGTCNPSISSSAVFSNAMMYFDFGATSGFTYPRLGTWGVHTRIFIARIDTTILRWYDIPRITPAVPVTKGQGERTGKDQWDNPEWSNHPYFAAASMLTNRLWKLQPSWAYQNSMTHEQVYGINLKDSSYFRLVQLTDTSYTAGIDILWPFLWVEMPAGFASVEDTNWLKSERPNAVRDYRGSKRPYGIHMNHGIITAPAGIKRVSIYSLNGRLLRRIVPGRAVTTMRLPRFNNSGAVFLVKTEPVTGTAEVVSGTW